MRILMVAQFFPPTLGGEERMVEAMSVGLAQRGHDVAVATLQTGGLPEFEQHDGVDVYRIVSSAQRIGGLHREGSRPHALPGPDPGSVHGLMKVIRRHRPDVIHGHNWLSNSLLPLKRMANAPIVLSLHDYSFVCATKRMMHHDQPCDGPSLGKCTECASHQYGAGKTLPMVVGVRGMEATARSMVDLFLPISRTVAQRCALDRHGVPWEVLPNFLPAGTVAKKSAPPVEGLPADGFTLMCGDLTADKGVETLLDAHAKLPDAPPLVLIGRPLSPRLESPPDNVIVLGPRPHEQVMAAWRHCGVAVAPSVWAEPFGLVALEAMASGRAVVATRHGGLGEVVADGKTGILVSPGDRRELRRALRRLHRDGALREQMGAAGKRRAKRYTPDRVLPQLENVYERLMPLRRHPAGGRRARAGRPNGGRHARALVAMPMVGWGSRLQPAGSPVAVLESAVLEPTIVRRGPAPPAFPPRGRPAPAAPTTSRAPAAPAVAPPARPAPTASPAPAAPTVTPPARPAPTALTTSPAPAPPAVAPPARPAVAPRQRQSIGLRRPALPQGPPLPASAPDRTPPVTPLAGPPTVTAPIPGRGPRDLGWIAPLTLLAAAGLLLVALSDAFSRSGGPAAAPLLWAGLAVILLPCTLRLSASSPNRGERVALVLLTGVALYLVKVLRDPFAFTYGDELVHQYNVQAILSSGGLLGRNPILAVTPLYPGLEAFTASLSSLTGLSTFTCGLLVAGLARVILMLALFLFAATVTGSSRIAGLAAVLYAAAPNFLFFTAQFSYESLALPLALVVGLATVRARPSAGPWRRSWAVLALLAALAVAATHHITSFALVAFLVGLCVLPTRGRFRRPWALALAAVAAVAGWQALVAGRTIDYLSPIVSDALRDTLRTAAGEAAPRQLFHSASGTLAPGWEHMVGIGSILLIVVLLPFGAVLLWRRNGRSPAAVMMALATIGYLGTLGLRFVPTAWETGARASEFLFIGVAVVAAVGGLAIVDRLSPWLRWTAVAAAAALLFAGGVVGGSSPERRLAHPYRVAAQGAALDPPGVAVARWVRTVLGTGSAVAAEDADANLLLVQGDQARVVTGVNPPISGLDPPIDAVLATATLYRWQLDVLKQLDVRYVVIDRRRASLDVIAGTFFPRRVERRFADAVVGKFERAGAQRIYDSGDLIVDDLKGVRREAAA
jgi:glycosyltransferase involved in cell wall biosynthesis